MRQGVAWLYAELPQLVERGVLTAEAAAALRRHYGPSDSAMSRIGWGQILLASFGALLVGGGIILILAHNWDGLGRPARAAVALTLLLAAQALTLYAVARRAQSVLWREATSALLVAAVGAAIALIGQTYHLGGSFEGVMRAWLWLVVLVPYVTGSNLAAIGFWSLLAVRVLNIAWHDAPADLWPLALAGFPFVATRLRLAPQSWATALVAITAMASVFVLGSVVTGAMGWTGLWAVFEVSYLGALIAAASWPPNAGATEIWRVRLLLPAWLALIVVGTILTFDDAWKDVLISERQARNMNVVIAAVVSAACAIFASIVAVKLARAGRMVASAGAGAAMLVVLMHLFAMFGLPQPGWILFNVWLLVVGILTLIEGLRLLEQGVANRGLVALAALIVARFFDTELSFLARGLAFVAFGLACFGLNLWLMRRVRKAAA
jgi:uncharacterized membrane protein